MNTELLRDTLQDARGIAWDTCHKIYVLMDDKQMELMKQYEYDPLISADEMTVEEMFDQVIEWYADSCGLRFIEATATNGGNTDFITIVPQLFEQEEEDND